MNRTQRYDFNNIRKGPTIKWLCPMPSILFANFILQVIVNLLYTNLLKTEWNTSTFLFGECIEKQFDVFHKVSVFSCMEQDIR